MTLEVRGIVAGYTKEMPILHGVSMTAERGKVTAVIGPNGAGKSTLLKTVYGYLHPSAGEVVHCGKAITRMAPEEMLGEGIAYLLQGHSVFPKMTVEENLALGAWMIKHDHAAVQEAFDAVYARFPELDRRRKEQAGVLSGGQQRMLEIARLTMTHPRTFLLDEPSVGLMPKLVDAVYDEIRKLKEDQFTLLIVDQNVKKAIEIADYVYVLRLGENSHQGTHDRFEARLEEIIKEWL